MLKLKYNINSSSGRRDIVLDDMYVAPDLSLVSGTTEYDSSYVVGGTVWVSSPYFPDEIPADIMSTDVVKRDGFILSPLMLQVHKGYTVGYGELSGTSIEVRYCEYNGNTYYESSDGKFVIDGNTYDTSGNTFVTINDKHYIEDRKVVIDSIEYNVIINNDMEMTFTDSIGRPFMRPSSWIVESYESSFNVEKIVIGGNVRNVLGCKSASYYGHRGYIVYQGEKYYIHYFSDNSGAGVTINGVDYDCTDLFNIIDYAPGESYNIYDITQYYNGDGDYPYMVIDGNKYQIYFEAGEIDGSGIICIETEEEFPQVLINDRIIIKKLNFSNSAIVEEDEIGGRFVYLNMRKYDVIDDICDCVVIEGVEYPISYESGPSDVHAGTIASATMNDGSVSWFRILTDSGDTAERVYRTDSGWETMYTIGVSGSVVTYLPSPEYPIVHHDGIVVGDTKLQVHRYEYTTSPGTVSSTTTSYEYVTVNSMLEYGLKVINTVGSNRILCVPDVDLSLYGESVAKRLTAEILSSIRGERFVVEKRNNTFGQVDLYYDTWMPQAALSSGSTSVYELADVQNNIKLSSITPSFNIPIPISVDTSHKIAYDDLIESLYCAEEDEKAINGIVDMEKDIYSPVFVSGSSITDVESIVFNLHFRTRDLDTWQINIDEGTYTSGSGTTSAQTVNLTANYQYTNYFVTDYYPFYQYIWHENQTEAFSPERFSKAIERSDLLGFMFFTTDDAKVGREKLRKSFLRLTFFDSKDPENQNMLGTSTVFFDCDRYMNLLYSGEYVYHYEECCASRNPNRTETGSESEEHTQDIMPSVINSPTVLTQAFNVSGETVTTADLYTGDENVVLDSRITITNRYDDDKPSEGFYAYILKAFSDKTKPKTIYMKVEFFHAGLGIKVPMVLPTTSAATEGSYSAITEWNEAIYKDFTNGYGLDSVFDRMYIPITVEYSTKLRKFIYRIQDEGGYMDSVNKDYKGWVINLFELKTKPQ